MKINKEILNSFLEFYWLRPENAVVKYFQSHSWNDLDIKGNSIDISTGDGVYAFLHSGGRFNLNFDLFHDTRSNKFSHNKFIDIYDFNSKKYNPIISRRPKKYFTYGTDWKKYLLERAKKLNYFKNLVHHDNNDIPLPFEDQFFDFIHSNSLYWTNNPNKLISDINRIAKRDSYVVLEYSTIGMLSTLYKMKPILDKKSFDILNRKRTDEMKGVKGDVNFWINIIKKNNFVIEDLRAAWPNQILTDFWNIGLRPVSHLLIEMTKKLKKEDRVSIKKEWVKIFYDILFPLCTKPKPFKPKEASYVTFILRKK